MRYDSLKPGLVALVKGMIGLETIWSGEPEPYNPDIFCRLSLGANPSIYVERRTAYDSGAPQGEELSDTLNGLSSLTVTVKVEALNQVAVNTPQGYLETLRDRIHSLSARDALDALNLGLQDVTQIFDLGAPQDERTRAVAAVDVIFNLMTNEADSTFVNGTDTPNRYGWIETVEVTDTDTGETFTAP